jgi:hypothetical protein
MKFYYHVLNLEETLAGSPDGEERVAMDWIPMPAGMVSPPRIGETMTLGSIDEKDALLLKVMSVHWEVDSITARCLITVIDEEHSAEAENEASTKDLAKMFSSMGGKTGAKV